MHRVGTCQHKWSSAHRRVAPAGLDAAVAPRACCQQNDVDLIDSRQIAPEALQIGGLAGSFGLSGSEQAPKQVTAPTIPRTALGSDRIRAGLCPAPVTSQNRKVLRDRLRRKSTGARDRVWENPPEGIEPQSLPRHSFVGHPRRPAATACRAPARRRGKDLPRTDLGGDSLQPSQVMVESADEVRLEPDGIASANPAPRTRHSVSARPEKSGEAAVRA